MDKLKMSSRHAVQMDASFALRGLVDGTSCHWKMDGLPRSGVPRVSHLPSSLVGSRTIYGNRMLSEPIRVVSNRPLSPHLPVKKPQFYATFSISHRIFGVALTSLIMLTPMAYKFSVLYDV